MVLRDLDHEGNEFVSRRDKMVAVQSKEEVRRLVGGALVSIGERMILTESSQQQGGPFGKVWLSEEGAPLRPIEGRPDGPDVEDAGDTIRPGKDLGMEIESKASGEGNRSAMDQRLAVPPWRCGMVDQSRTGLGPSVLVQAKRCSHASRRAHPRQRPGCSWSRSATPEARASVMRPRVPWTSRFKPSSQATRNTPSG